MVVVGHSFGGRVAVHLAASRPGQVGALVLTGVPRLVKPPRVERAKASFRIVRWLHGQGLVSDARMEALPPARTGPSTTATPTGVMRDVLVEAVNENYEELLPRITCPVELVWGDDDSAAPLALAQQAATPVRRRCHAHGRARSRAPHAAHRARCPPGAPSTSTVNP